MIPEGFPAYRDRVYWVFVCEECGAWSARVRIGKLDAAFELIAVLQGFDRGHASSDEAAIAGERRAKAMIDRMADLGSGAASGQRRTDALTDQPSLRAKSAADG